MIRMDGKINLYYSRNKDPDAAISNEFGVYFLDKEESIGQIIRSLRKRGFCLFKKSANGNDWVTIPDDDYV